VSRQTNIKGAILAGGRSSRMGCEKAMLDLDGKPFIAHIAENLQRAVGSVIIISNDSHSFEFLGLSVYGDIYRDCGPLGGIHSALTNAGTEKVFIISCDMPFVSADAIEYIISRENPEAMVTVPLVSNRLQPLCGIYKTDCLKALVDYLNRGERSVRGFVTAVEAIIIPLNYQLPFFHPLLFADVNTGEDYQKIRSGICPDIGH
jgi:molybdopterin-guanine dinucleotide biosynthesis protein A